MPLHLLVGLLAAVIVAGGLTVLIAPLFGGYAMVAILVLALVVRFRAR